MHYDGINLTEGSVVRNLAVDSAPDLPASATVGELFYLTTGETGLYIYDGTSWINLAAESVVGAIGQVPFVVKTANSAVPNALVLGSLAAGFVKNSGVTGNLTSVGSVNLSGSDVSGILASARFPSLSGDLTSSDGSTVISLVNTGITPGTYNRVTVDAKGRVTSAIAATTLAALGITDGASISGSISQDFTARDISLAGDLLPLTNGTQEIGNESKHWGKIFVNDANIDTLTLGSIPVLSTVADVVTFRTAPTQSISIDTIGGQTTVNSDTRTNITTFGVNADVVVQATGPSSEVIIGATEAVKITAPTTKIIGDAEVSEDLLVSGNATITGNLIVHGTQTIVNSTTVTTKDNIVLINDGEPGDGVTSGLAGLQIDRGNLTDYQIVFDESDDMFKVGQVGQLETIASHNYTIANFAPITHVGSSGSQHATATQSVSGFMSSVDKTRLDNIEDNANAYVHPTSGVIPGTYSKVTVNVNGHVTAFESLIPSDIPELDWSKITSGHPTTIAGFGITDAYTKVETDSRIQAVIDSAPAALDTLNELAAALGDDANFAATMTTSLATKLNEDEVTSTATADKILRLDGSAKLPTSITGNAATATNVLWDGVQLTPTTIAGYGITDAYTKSEIDATISTVQSGNVASSSEAAKLTTPRSISITGDLVWSTSFDGTANVTSAGTLANSGVTAGTYPKVTVNAKGLVTSGTNLVESDIPSLDWSKLTSGKPTTLAGYGINDAAPLSHISDYTVHLTAGQNTWLDAITATSVEVNYLSGVTSSVQTQINSKQPNLGYTAENLANKGVANGYAGLGSDGKVPAAQLPSYVDDVLEAANLAAFPATGETGKIYVALDNNKIYRWTGTVYIEISPTVGNSDTATKLATARTISLSGDVTGSASFDGSANITIAATVAAGSVALGTDTTGNYVATLAAGTAGAQSGTSGLTISATAGESVAATIALSTTGVAAGTYRSVTVDTQGRVTAATNPTTVAGYGLTDVYTKTQIDSMVVDGGTY